MEAAQKLVKLAASWWNPDLASAGARSAAVQNLARYEARSVASRIRAWHVWVDFCRVELLDPVSGGTADAIARACASQASPTAGPSLWDRLDFLRRHLGAPLRMPPKPARAAVRGIVEGEAHGVTVEPEMLVRMDGVDSSASGI